MVKFSTSFFKDISSKDNLRQLNAQSMDRFRKRHDLNNFQSLLHSATFLKMYDLIKLTFKCQVLF